MTALEMLMEKGCFSDCVCDPQYQHSRAKTLVKNSADHAEVKETVTKAFLDGQKREPTSCSFVLQSMARLSFWTHF